MNVFVIQIIRRNGFTMSLTNKLDIKVLWNCFQFLVNCLRFIHINNLFKMCYHGEHQKDVVRLAMIRLSIREHMTLKLTHKEDLSASSSKPQLQFDTE